MHNGYVGWAYGSPGDPQLISDEDAQILMARTGLSIEQVSAEFPPAQFAEKDTKLFSLVGGNRFLCYGDITKCGDIRKGKSTTPLPIDWSKI
jgi:hypothetical protein